MSLFVCNFFDTGHSFWRIIKLKQIMYLCHVTMPIVFLGQGWNNWVTRSRRRSNFEIAITQSILKLDRWSKAQNSGKTLGYQCDILNFRRHLWRKSFLQPQNIVSFENFSIFNIASIWHQVWKDHMHVIQKKSMFYSNDLANEVTAWPQIQPDIFMFK